MTGKSEVLAVCPNLGHTTLFQPGLMTTGGNYKGIGDRESRNKLGNIPQWHSDMYL